MLPSRHLTIVATIAAGLMACVRPLAAQTVNCSDPIERTQHLRFMAGTIVHHAHLRMRGCTGVMYVRYFDVIRNREIVVAQTMRATQLPQGVMLTGSNPVDSGTGLVQATYSPDKITFRVNADGVMEALNCDKPNQCSPVEQATTVVVENLCANPITVAVAYADAGDEQWVRAGWLNVEPSRSLVTQVQTFADSFYIHAESPQDSRTWSGPDSFVVSAGEPFRMGVNQLQLSRTAHRVGFAKVRMQPRPVTYTQQFTCRARG